MFKNYLTVALRNLRNNKAFASLNIIGMAVGMATAILIGLWIYDEMSFDHGNPNHSSIAQVMITQSHNEDSYTGTTIAMPLGMALQSQYKNLFKNVSLVSFNDQHVLAVGDKKFLPGVCSQKNLFRPCSACPSKTECRCPPGSVNTDDLPIARNFFIRQ